MSQPFDSIAVRAWAALALEALGQGRDEIDAINVFPVADGDTGTNLYRTARAAADALDAATDGPGEGAASPLGALARGALLGACGNSGSILAQLLHGMAEVYRRADDPDDAGGAGVSGTREPDPAGSGELLARALRRAAESAYEAVARPVEGTMLTVARAAADAAGSALHGQPHAEPALVARAAHDGARSALASTTAQLEVLRKAGVVDAGGSGLAAVLAALAAALSGSSAVTRAVGGAPAGPVAGASAGEPGRKGHRAAGAPDVRAGGESSGRLSGVTGEPGSESSGETAGQPAGEAASAPAGAPAYEVMYLLDADDTAVAALRTRLDGLGDSLVVGGGGGLWSVHVHVDDAGAAVEAGVEAGRPHRIRIEHLGAGAPGHGAAGSTAVCDGQAGRTGGPLASPADGAPDCGAGAGGPVRPRTVVAVVHGDGLAALCEEAGAIVVRDGDATAPGTLPRAVRDADAAEVVLLPNDADLHAHAARAAEEVRRSQPGIRVAVVPTRAAVQGIAALAVHDTGSRFDEDVVAMTAAAGATRYGEVAVAERRSWTTAGVCEAGDVLGLVEGDVAVIGSGLADTAADVLERMLAAGGEMVTLVVGEQAPAGLAARLEAQVRGRHLAVDTVVYEGGRQCAPLLIGVE